MDFELLILMLVVTGLLMLTYFELLMLVLLVTGLLMSIDLKFSILVLLVTGWLMLTVLRRVDVVVHRHIVVVIDGLVNGDIVVVVNGFVDGDVVVVGHRFADVDRLEVLDVVVHRDGLADIDVGVVIAIIVLGRRAHIHSVRLHGNRMIAAEIAVAADAAIAAAIALDIQGRAAAEIRCARRAGRGGVRNIALDIGGRRHAGRVVKPEIAHIGMTDLHRRHGPAGWGTKIGMSQDRPLIMAPLPASPLHVPTWVMPPACAEMEVATRLVPTRAEVRNIAGLSDIYVFLAPKGA